MACLLSASTLESEFEGRPSGKKYFQSDVCLEFLFASHFSEGPGVANLIVSLRSFQVFICFAIYGIGAQYTLLVNLATVGSCGQQLSRNWGWWAVYTALCED